MENLWNLYGSLMEILYAFDGKAMDFSWKFHGENTRLECGETVKHLWRIDTLENRRLENTKTC